MEEKSSAEYEEHKEEIINIIINSFDKLIKSDCFDNESITYFVTMSDGEGIYEIENYSVKLLNSDAIYEQFLNRMNIE